jgi:hypothetical protein
MTRRSGLGLVALVLAVTACVSPPAQRPLPPSPAPGALTLPPGNAGFDYQIGRYDDPPEGVTVVSRDREAPPVEGLYNICYVNGFQTQPGETDWWLANHPDLVLMGDGGPVEDTRWDELLLDISTPAKRAALAAIVGEWVDGCRRDGFQAVEIDNLDTYSRSGGRLTTDQAVAYQRLLADRAHAAGLAVAQKNAAEIVDRRAEMGTDFALAEACNRWSECDAYTRGYGDRVLVVEYRQVDFDRGCADWPGLSIVLRDENLETTTRPDQIC